MARQNPENLIAKLGFLGLGGLGIWLAFRKKESAKEDEAVQLVRRQQKLIDTRTEEQKQLAVEMAVAAAASPFIPAAASFVAGKRGSRSGKRSYVSGGKFSEGEIWIASATLGSKSWDDMNNTQKGNDCMERLRILHNVTRSPTWDTWTPGGKRDPYRIQRYAIDQWPKSMGKSIQQAGSFKAYKKSLYRCVERFLGAEAYLRAKNMYGKASMLPEDLGMMWVYPEKLTETKSPGSDNDGWLVAEPCQANFVKHGYTTKHGFDETMFYDPWGPGCPGAEGTWRGQAAFQNDRAAPVERQKAWQAYYYDPRLFSKPPTKSKPSWADPYKRDYSRSHEYYE